MSTFMKLTPMVVCGLTVHLFSLSTDRVKIIDLWGLGDPSPLIAGASGP